MIQEHVSCGCEMECDATTISIDCLGDYLNLLRCFFLVLNLLHR